MIIFEELSQEVTKKISDWKSKKESWWKRAIEAKGYFRNDIEGTGTTYNRQQVENIKSNTNIPVSINFIHPIVSQKHALMSEHNVQLKIIPTDQRSKEYAFVLDKASRAILRESSATMHNREALKEMLITGLCHFGIVDRDFYTPGEFNLAYQWISSEYITVDPYSTDVTNQDSEGYVYEKEITETVFKHVYGKMLDTMNRYYGTNYTIEDFQKKTGMTLGQEKTILIRKIVTRAVTKMYYVEDVETGEIRREFKENYFPEQVDSIFHEELLRGDPDENMFVKVTLVWGDKVVERKFLPTNYIPLRTSYFEWGGSPYTSYGVVHFLRGMQDAMDKSLQTMILNGILQNNRGWKSPKGGILKDDAPSWSNLDPRVIREYVPQVFGDQVLIPELDETGQLGNYFPMIIQMMQQGMEYSSGINALMYGDPTQMPANQPFSSLQQYTSSAMKRINDSMKAIEFGQEYIGKVLIQLLLANIQPGHYGFFDEKSEFDEVEVTKEMLRELRQSNYRVLAVPSEGSPTQMQAMAKELMILAQTIPDVSMRVPYMRKAFSLSGIRGFEQMEEEINEIKRLNLQMEELYKQLERDKEIMKQFENQTLIAQRNEKAVLSKTEIMIAEMEAKKDIIIEKLEQQLREAKKPVEKKSESK